MDWDFIANASVDVIDIVPENIRGYYEEDKANGKFVLKADIKPLAEAYTGASKKLKTVGLQRQEDNRKDATRRAILDQVTSTLTEVGWEIGDDITKIPEIVKTKVTELLDQVKGGKEVRTNLEAIKKDFDKRVLEVTTKKDSELANMRKSLETYMIDSAAAAALAEAGTVDGGLDLIMPLVRKFSKVVAAEDGTYTVKVVDAENNVRLDNSGNEMSIKSLVNEMKTKYPMAFKSSTPAGGGKPPGSGKLPTGQQVPGRSTEKSSVAKISAGLANLGSRR
jgi:hypothetical protein